MVCGGANDCNAGTDCAQYCSQTGTELQPCGANATVESSYFCDNPPCPDGTLALPLNNAKPSDVPLLGQCVVDEIGQLFHRNNADSRLLYADFSAYDGAPLPQPSSCPTLPGLTLCGGSCGDTCPHDGGFSPHVCFGRSKKHPYSLCAVNGGTCSTSDQSNCKTFGTETGSAQGCLLFLDDSADQSIADIHGICVDQTTCNAAASSYPGGAKCI